MTTDLCSNQDPTTHSSGEQRVQYCSIWLHCPVHLMEAGYWEQHNAGLFESPFADSLMLLFSGVANLTFFPPVIHHSPYILTISDHCRWANPTRDNLALSHHNPAQTMIHPNQPDTIWDMDFGQIWFTALMGTSSQWCRILCPFLLLLLLFYECSKTNKQTIVLFCGAAVRKKKKTKEYNVKEEPNGMVSILSYFEYSAWHLQ